MSFFRRSTPKNLDQQLVFQLSKSRIPSLRQLKYITRYINKPERWLLGVCVALMGASLIYMGIQVYKNHVVLIPKAGGDYIEGAVGNPRYINPLYASLNDVDGDLEKLIFSRLFSVNGKGQAVNDLAEDYSLSEDGKTYTIHLRKASWPTGEAVTADDVVFTFNAIENPDFKSPLRDRFSGVIVQKIDDQTVSFTLREPFGRFPAMLDVGILPSSQWEGVSSETIPLAELNLKPIGSGPYRFKSLVKNKTGTIRSFTLERNPDYYGAKPYLDEIIFKFFPSPEEMIASLNNGQLNGMSYLPADLGDTIIAKNSLHYNAIAEPNLSAAFFNLKSQGPIADAAVRRALSAVDRSTIISNSNMAAIPALGPLPNNQPASAIAPLTKEEAKILLDNAGWKERTLSSEEVEAAKSAKNSGDIVRLGVGTWRMKNNAGLIIPLIAPTSLKASAEALTKDWQSLGAKVELTIQDDAVVRDQTLANKRFDVLVYTEALAGGEPYLFWHSDAPGNISGYKSSAADTALEEARTAANPETIASRYNSFLATFNADMPAVPLFWQAYVYPQSKKLKGFNQSFLENPSDRLSGAAAWYLKVERSFKK